MNSRSYAQAHTWSHEHIIALRDMIQRDICILQIHWYTMIQYPLFLHPPKISMHTQKSFLHSFVTALCLLERWELSSSLWQVNFGMLENSLKPQKDTLKFHGLSVYTRNPLVFCFRKLEWSWVAIMLSQSPKFPHTPRSSALKWYYGWPWPSVLKPMVSSKFSELNPGFTQWIWDYNPTSVEDSSAWIGVLVNSLAQLNNYCHEDRNRWKSWYFHGHGPRILG